MAGGTFSTIKSFFGAETSGDAPKSALEMIRDGHERVQRLFEEFESSEGAERRRVVPNALRELVAHTAMEEEIFYPRLRRKVGADDPSMFDEALEEHHVAKVLIGELQNMAPGDERFDAKFKVLAEAVRHHIREEESKMLPRAEGTDLDLAQLGQEMARVKERVQRSGRARPRSERRQTARDGARASRSSSAAERRSPKKRANQPPRSGRTSKPARKRRARPVASGSRSKMRGRSRAPARSR